MRFSSSIASIFAAALLSMPACGDAPIGQPCTFGWPKNSAGDRDCTGMPICFPLQKTGSSVNNSACPVDCIQMPAMDCENLICVATQVEGEANHMNGQCKNSTDAGYSYQSPDCAGAPMGCGGYCTKECMSDASCPKGYRCSAMAPFKDTLNCASEASWGTSCTESCTDEGLSPEGSSVICPSSQGDKPDYTMCNGSAYSKCCACICNQFCPILSKKFCRKVEWDRKLFPDATTGAACQEGT